MENNLGIIIAGIAGILIPISILVAGQRFTVQREKADRARREAETLETFLEHLSSESMERRKLALLALAHLYKDGKLPPALMAPVLVIAAPFKNPELAAFARLALGESREALNSTLAMEVLLPIKLHLERSRDIFQRWIQLVDREPNTWLEDDIRESNLAIYNLINRSWSLIPVEYYADAKALLKHYEAWFEEYDRLRPGGVRNPNVPYVFVGPKGEPFPTDAERRFIELYEKYTQDEAKTETLPS